MIEYDWEDDALVMEVEGVFWCADTHRQTKAALYKEGRLAFECKWYKGASVRPRIKDIVPAGCAVEFEAFWELRSLIRREEWDWCESFKIEDGVCTSTIDAVRQIAHKWCGCGL